MMLQRRKYPYYEWEDYKAGIYNLRWDAGKTDADATSILRDLPRLKDGMSRAVEEWPKAAAHHLTDNSVNQRSWLGWAACGILDHIPSHVTRAAWWQLSETERAAANKVADQVIAAYEDRHAQTLFNSQCA